LRYLSAVTWIKGNPCPQTLSNPLYLFGTDPDIVPGNITKDQVDNAKVSVTLPSEGTADRASAQLC